MAELLAAERGYRGIITAVSGGVARLTARTTKIAKDGGVSSSNPIHLRERRGRLLNLIRYFHDHNATLEQQRYPQRDRGLRVRPAVAHQCFGTNWGTTMEIISFGWRTAMICTDIYTSTGSISNR